MKNSIVTKTGDDGKTYLLGGVRVPKNDLRVKTYGEIDELNSIIGLTICHSSSKNVIELALVIQNHLFEIGSILATPDENQAKFYPRLELELKEYLGYLEDKINELEPTLPTLKNFILPGGSVSSSYFHLARTVCRRVERTILDLMSNFNVNIELLKFFNRLSDLLFILARYENITNNVEDKIWKGRNK